MPDSEKPRPLASCCIQVIGQSEQGALSKLSTMEWVSCPCTSDPNVANHLTQSTVWAETIMPAEVLKEEEIMNKAIAIENRASQSPKRECSTKIFPILKNLTSMFRSFLGYHES
jgi:hypothetical protein